MNLPEITPLAEAIELRRMEVFWGVLPPDLARKRKLEWLRVGGALVTLAPKSTSLTRNSVRGLGVEEPATEAVLDHILQLFRNRGIERLSFHVSPCRQSEAIAGWLKQRGFRFHHSYAKLVRDVSAPARVEEPFRVRRAAKPDAEVFSSLFCQLFAWPPDYAAWIAALIGAPGFTHYLALAGSRPVAIGSVFNDGDCAGLCWAGTLAPYRRRGAHTALIAARLKRAAALGAKWAVCETLEPLPGRPGGSYRGLLRQGFTQAYLRPIWVWEGK